MNVRKSVDYSAMFTALDVLMTTVLPQMKLYCEIGKVVSGRTEKGAAVAAAEYLCNAYPNTPGFSPRNLRRMREFYRTYESDPAAMAEAMTVGWTQNVVILEAALSLQEKVWYIQAARQSGWSKLELQKKIAASAHMEISLDNTEVVCYTEENTSVEETSSRAAVQDLQCYRTGNPGSIDGFPAILCLFRPQFLHRGVYPQPLLVRGGYRRPVGVADGGGAPRQGGLWQALCQENRASQPRLVFQSCQLPAQWVRLRLPLRGRSGKLPREIHYGCTAPGGANAVQGSEADDRLWRRWTERFRYGNDWPAGANLYHSPQRVCLGQIWEALWLGHCPLCGDGGCSGIRSDAGRLRP